ncbi:hypothetical protein RJ639_033228, partial [Escallonia herrerae]
YYTGYPKDLGPSRIIHFTSEREFVLILHEGRPMVECPKYPGFCITWQKDDYPFVEIFHSPEQAASQGRVADPNITKYSVKVLPFIKDDINAVERHRIELYWARDRYPVKLRMLGNNPTAAAMGSWSLSTDENNSGLVTKYHNAYGEMTSGNFRYKKFDGKAQVGPLGPQRKDAQSGLTSQHMSQSGLDVVRKKRVHSQITNAKLGSQAQIVVVLNHL